MKLTTIALAVGLVISGAAVAQEPLTNPVKNQADIDKLGLSSGDLTLEWVDKAFDMSGNGVSLTGNGENSLTLTANKTKNESPGYGFRLDNVTGNVAFTNFSKLELASAWTDGSGSFILANGTVSFGNQSQALGSLKFTNLTVGRWAGERNVLDIYSQALEFDTDQSIGIGIAMNIYNVAPSEGQKQLSQFKKVNVNGGTFKAYGGALSFSEGLLSGYAKDDNEKVFYGAVVLGTKDSPVDAVTIQKDFSVSTGSKVDIVSSDLVSIQKESGRVQSSGTLTIDANDITIAGGLSNKGQLTLHAANELRLEKGKEDWIGSLYAPENSTTTIAADKFLANGTISTQAETTITATNIEISTGSSTAIGVSGEKGSLTFGKTGGDQTLSISSSGSAALVRQGKLIVESGNLITNGTLQTNGGTIAIGTADQPLESVNLSGSRSTATVRTNGGDVSIFAKDVTIGNSNGYAVSAFTLQREGESDTGNLSIQATNNLTIVGDISVGTDENSSQGYTTQNGNIVIQGGTGTNTIIGDVETYNGNAYTNQDQETALKSANTVSISLSGENSTFIGAVVDNKDEALEALVTVKE